MTEELEHDLHEQRLTPAAVEQYCVEQRTDLVSLQAAQERFAASVSGEVIGVVDMTSDGYQTILKTGLDYLRNSGQTADLMYHDFIVKELFGGQLPRHAADVFKLLLGDKPRVVNIPIKDFHYIVHEPELAAMLISGSAANVTDALGDKAFTTGIAKQEVIHKDALALSNILTQMTQECYRKGVGIPTVMGVCYGSQSLAHYYGNTVSRLEQQRLGTGMTQPTSYGSVVLEGGLDFTNPMERLHGTVPLVHGDAVDPTTLSEHSTVIMQSNDQVVHGMIHAETAQFTHMDAAADAKELRRVLDSGKTAALGLQFHPELQHLINIIEFSLRLQREGKPHYSLLTRKIDNLSPNILTLLGQFMQRQ